MSNEKQKGTGKDRALTILGIILCVILVPVLIINCTLLIKGAVNADEVPSIGGIFPMIVLSDSMHPVFSEGDLIICREIDAEDVKVNDVISFFDPESKTGAVVTHRVYEISTGEKGLLFHTKGDFNDSADSDPIPADKLVGIYTGTHIGGAGNVAMFMQTTQGMIVCVALPSLLLVGYDFTRRKLYEKKYSQDKDQLMAELEELRKLKEQMETKNEER